MRACTWLVLLRKTAFCVLSGSSMVNLFTHFRPVDWLFKEARFSEDGQLGWCVLCACGAQMIACSLQIPVVIPSTRTMLSSVLASGHRRRHSKNISSAWQRAIVGSSASTLCALSHAGAFDAMRLPRPTPRCIDCAELKALNWRHRPEA